jgi:hypothetical protein
VVVVRAIDRLGVDRRLLGSGDAAAGGLGHPAILLPVGCAGRAFSPYFGRIGRWLRHVTGGSNSRRAA